MHIKKSKRVQWRYPILIVMILLFYSPFHIKAANEAPERVFTGRPDPDAVLANLDYQDVINSDTWAKDAIWETGALELMKGYGAKRFGLSDMLTVEQALAVAYNMAGREAEAQLAAQELDLKRDAADKKNMAPAMWSDGYLQLAFNDGLITQEEYDDAFSEDQRALGPADFRRGSPATREDMAFYIAKVMEMTPVNAQTHLFNSFVDWQEANPHRIPYIEALLQNRVMNGNNGRFSPKGPVTREQAAQILQNAEPFLFSRLNMEKMKGFIEKITRYEDKTSGREKTVTYVNVRCSDGMLHQFQFSRPYTGTAANELTGNNSSALADGTIVNAGNILYNEAAMREGQLITYIVRGNQVHYVTVVEGQKKTEYKLVKILSTDESAGMVRCDMITEIPFPDIRLLSSEGISRIDPTGKIEELTVSKDASIIIDLVNKTLRDVKPESLMLLTLENGLITRMEKVHTRLLQEEGIVSGTLEEINPVLGYITLYFPDGSGTSPEAGLELSSFRTYSWMRPDRVTVYKNGNAATFEDLKPGDSVFIRLDQDGTVKKISGADNYYPVYGRVRTKGNGLLQLEKQDGTALQLLVPENTPMFHTNRRIYWSDLSEGDNVRILLQTAGNATVIGEITVEKQRLEAKAIYKGQMNYFDSLSRNLVVSGLQQFTNGIWKPSEERGFVKLPLNENYRPEIPKGAQGTVYLAIGENMLGNDTIIRMSIDDQSLQTEISNDTILQARPGQGSLTLMNGDMPLVYDEDSLIIKGGKLLEPNQVKSMDEVTFVAGSLPDGTRKANILWLREPAVDTGLTLLRGRITQIDALSSMTLQSFSQFRNPEWEYVNVPKTLTIDPATTRILDDDGRTDLDVFDDTGTESYKNRTVYVLNQEGKAMLVSTAPYGDIVCTGRIKTLTGLARDSFGHIVSPASSILVSEAMEFNPGTWKWQNKPDTVYTLLPNTVLFKNGIIIDAGLLEVGDRVTVIRAISGNNAFVVIAESY
ncbi:MAG: S-layer homology domain-containing protein [Clostridiaceae bacterium]|nr:S-layer homology domain-containing protein [Clostridiaceae bacterium]